jgi:hypothetical protein
MIVGYHAMTMVIADSNAQQLSLHTGQQGQTHTMADAALSRVTTTAHVYGFVTAQYCCSSIFSA